MKYIITGVSSGLGYRIAEQLIPKKKVVGISRNLGSAKSLISSENFYHFQFDLTKSSEEKNFKSFVSKLKKFLKKDEFCLIINAAQFYSGTIRMNSNKRENLFSLNVFSVFDLVDQLKKFNLKRIFVINSISGLIGQSLQHEYSASKHALMGYTRSLIKEAKTEPYDVMCINPGGINTELWENFDNKDKASFLEPKELAKIIVFLSLIKQRMFIENMIILPDVDI